MASRATPAISAARARNSRSPSTSGITSSRASAGSIRHSCGRPRVCIRTAPHPSAAQVEDIAASHRCPLTSLTISAPASTAMRAVSAWYVSMDRIAPVRAARIARSTGITRACSSAAVMGVAFGRVDSPPRSRRSAPSSSICSACATAGSRSMNLPPSENESGVTLRMPMMRVRGPSSRVRVRRRQEKRARRAMGMASS
jgi:hypothetical protein